MASVIIRPVGAVVKTRWQFSVGTLSRWLKNGTNTELRCVRGGDMWETVAQNGLVCSACLAGNGGWWRGGGRQKNLIWWKQKIQASSTESLYNDITVTSLASSRAPCVAFSHTHHRCFRARTRVGGKKRQHFLGHLTASNWKYYCVDPVNSRALELAPHFAPLLPRWGQCFIHGLPQRHKITEVGNDVAT